MMVLLRRFFMFDNDVVKRNTIDPDNCSTSSFTAIFSS